MYDITITSGRLRQRKQERRKTMNSISTIIECPECKSTHVNKNGHKAGKQNHICVDCGRQFIDCYQAQQGYTEEIKRECLSIDLFGI